jgi:hypothetical protein
MCCRTSEVCQIWGKSLSKISLSEEYSDEFLNQSCRVVLLMYCFSQVRLFYGRFNYKCLDSKLHVK